MDILVSCQCTVCCLIGLSLLHSFAVRVEKLSVDYLIFHNMLSESDIYPQDDGDRGFRKKMDSADYCLRHLPTHQTVPVSMLQ